MEFLLALGMGALSIAGGVAAGAASMATSILSGAAGVVTGTGAALFGGGLTVSQKMAAIAEPGYYGSAGVGILGGLPAAATSTVDYLGNLTSSAMGVFQLISPPKEAEAPPTAKVMPSVTAPTIAKFQLPLLGTQAPMIMTTGVAAKPGAPNYMLYIGLAVLALFLLRKK